MKSLRIVGSLMDGKADLECLLIRRFTYRNIGCWALQCWFAIHALAVASGARCLGGQE
jgi:hypothetical protein